MFIAYIRIETYIRIYNEEIKSIARAFSSVSLSISFVGVRAEHNNAGALCKILYRRKTANVHIHSFKSGFLKDSREQLGALVENLVLEV